MGNSFAGFGGDALMQHGKNTDVEPWVPNVVRKFIAERRRVLDEIDRFLAARGHHQFQRGSRQRILLEKYASDDRMREVYGLLMVECESEERWTRFLQAATHAREDLLMKDES